MMSLLREVRTISTEDLARYRMAQAKLEAMAVKPEGYSTIEIEQAYVAKWRLMGELLATYEVDDTKKWALTLEGGAFIVGDDYEPGV